MRRKETVMTFEEFFQKNAEIRSEQETKQVIGATSAIGGAVALGYGIPKYVAVTFGLVAGTAKLPLVLTAAGLVGIGYGITKVVDANYKIDATYEIDRFVTENGIPVAIESTEDIETYVDTVAEDNRAKVKRMRAAYRRAGELN